MLSFAPLSEIELLNLMPDGTYDFLVKEANHHRSQTTGNESIKLTLAVYDNNGREHKVYCYLTPAYMKLLAHFCNATGLTQAYEAGSLSAAMCVNQAGKCIIGRDEPEFGSKYSPKNVIVDFLKRESVDPPKSVIDPHLNDDIPF